jgi:2-iminobutanoate/2-iminopropanoate deaminase
VVAGGLTSRPRICVNQRTYFWGASLTRFPQLYTWRIHARSNCHRSGPQAIGPYSQAIRAAGLVFTSGQVAIDPATQQVVAGDISVQTDRVLKNLSGVLQSAGTSLDKALRCTVFLKNMGDFAAMNEVYGRYFTAAPPARTTVEASRLPKDVLVEIDVVALA